MTPLLFGGFWYSSAAALDLLAGGILVGTPHKTPEGKAVLVFDRGGLGSIVNGERAMVAPCLVPQAADGCTLNGQPIHDLMTLRGDRLHRIELDPSALPDLERLVEFDHLPEYHKAGFTSRATN
jgi:hypothetical protein